MYTYLKRTFNVVKFFGKLSITMVGTAVLGLTTSPTLLGLIVLAPVEYIITGDLIKSQNSFDFIENCRDILVCKIWR